MYVVIRNTHIASTTTKSKRRMRMKKQTRSVRNIFRDDKRGFVKISNELLHSGLSGNAFMVLSYMLSKPQGWVFRQPAIAEDLKLTLHATRMATTELQEKGYLNISKFRNPEGKGFTTQYWVYEHPELNKPFNK